MATDNVPSRAPNPVSASLASVPSAPPAERELIIDVNPEWGWVQYEGTRAQLEDEGLIPDRFEWPRAAGDVRWEANGFDYWLRRTRPDGHKGPMSSWWELDNWSVRVRVIGRDHAWLARRNLERRADALRAEFHRQTVAGQRERDANWKRYWATVDDKAFQEFKARIPGLIPPKRGRKPKTTT